MTSPTEDCHGIPSLLDQTYYSNLLQTVVSLMNPISFVDIIMSV